jgi:flagellar protein FlgJ
LEFRTEAVEGVSRRAEPPSRPERAADLARAAQEFEAYVLKMLLSEMRKSVQNGGLFTESSMDGYRALMDDALARRAAEAGSFGLAEQMLRQLESRR